MEKKLNGIDLSLLFVATFDTIFVITMIVIFCLFQSVPDTLVVAVIGATFGECGCCSYIWKIKKERQYEKDNGSSSATDLSDDSIHSGGEE